jgi:hypothetical protein
MLFLADVYKNEPGTLYLHQALLEQSFGIQPRKGQGRCLLTQIAYSISAVCPAVKASRIVTHVDKHVKRKVGDKGHTLDEIFKTFDKPIKVDNGFLKLDVQLGIVETYDLLITKMLIGQPVIMIIDSDVCAVLLNEALMYNDGEIRNTMIRHGQTGSYHSMLAMGLDLSGYVVLRDSRSKYAFKGYAKIANNILRDGWQFLAALYIQVNEATFVTP